LLPAEEEVGVFEPIDDQMDRCADVESLGLEYTSNLGGSGGLLEVDDA